MPLPVPELATRTWAELVEEGGALIVRDAPAWTDHNLHDPGITLLELFAFLTEALLYRANRVTPETQRAFLRLAGVDPAAPGVAETVVAVPPDGAARSLPAGSVAASAGGEARFATSEPLWVSPAWLELDPSEPTARGALAVEAGGALTDLRAANRGGRPFAPFGAAPQHGAALRIGFDAPPFATGRTLALRAWTDRWVDEDLVAPPSTPGDPLAAWEYWAGAAGWRAVEGAVDTTVALARSGRVLLPGPPDHVPGPGDARWWLRCRLVAGAHDRPPALARVAVNAVPVRHAVAAPGGELLGISRGEAGRRHALRNRPVVAGSTRLLIGGEDTWTEVAEWDRAGPYDRHYHLAPATGIVDFGDGRRGRIPPAGAELRVTAYATGGGAAGNVAAGTLTRLEAPQGGPVIQPVPARGGSDAETLAHAHGRALERPARAARAVTAEDFERLALATPDGRVARARALPGRHAALPSMEAHGVVTLVVLPPWGDPPRPTTGLLATVRRRVAPRRSLGTEVHVVGPTYRELTVEALLHARRGAPPDLVARAGAALRTFFDPLRGGPSGAGWPFGRDVLEAEVLAVLGGLPGVAYVDRLGLTGPGDAAPRCGNLPLCGAELVSLRPPRITVVEEDAA